MRQALIVAALAVALSMTPCIPANAATIAESQAAGMRMRVVVYQYDTSEYANGWASWDQDDLIHITFDNMPAFLYGATIFCDFDPISGSKDDDTLSDGRSYKCDFAYTTREKGWFGIMHDVTKDYETSVRFDVSHRQRI